MQLSERQLLKLNGVGTDNPKKCHCCKGIMVYQKFNGPYGHFWGWRCICCGEIIDQITLLENRRLVATGQLRR